MNINSYEEEANLSSDELESRNQKSKEILTRAGAHYVVDDINSLPEIIEDINRRLDKGETP